MSSPKPQKTIADYVVNSFGPVLIMLLVGALVFFLIQVFYRGHMAASIRLQRFVRHQLVHKAMQYTQKRKTPKQCQRQSQKQATM